MKKSRSFRVATVAALVDDRLLRFRHGNHQCFSCRGILIAIQEFLKRGHAEITVFVPQWRTKFHQQDKMPIRDQHLLEEMRHKGYLKFTPARQVPIGNGRYKNIASYDDRLELQTSQLPCVSQCSTECRLRAGMWLSWRP